MWSTDVAVDTTFLKDRVFVTDTYNDQVLVFERR